MRTISRFDVDGKAFAYFLEGIYTNSVYPPITYAGAVSYFLFVDTTGDGVFDLYQTDVSFPFRSGVPDWVQKLAAIPDGWQENLSRPSQIRTSNFHPMMSLCDLISHASDFDGRKVGITGELFADSYFTRIGSQDCARRIVLSYSSEKKSSEWKIFYKAAAAKSINSAESLRLIVTLEGKFKDNVCRNKNSCFSQIRVSRIVRTALFQ